MAIRYRDASVTPLDDAWTSINRLRLSSQQRDSEYHRGFRRACECALAVIESRGGHDPAARLLAQMVRERAEGRAM